MQKALEIPTQDSRGMLSWFREAGLFNRKKKSPNPFSDPLSLQQMVLSQVIYFLECENKDTNCNLSKIKNKFIY